jgi:RNA polymerase sigma factor for flagellar operon FliA
MSSGDEPTRPRCQRSADLLSHKPLVRQIARRIRARLPPSVGLDELEQAGLIGLNEALSRFEEGRGSTFESYAARRIEGSMLDALRAMDALPRELRSRMRRLRDAVQRLEHRLGRAPRAQEVANELGWTLDAFHRCMIDAGALGQRAGDPALDEIDGEADAAEPHGETESGEAQNDPLRSLQQRQRHAALNAAFDALEEAERYVMESIYKNDMSLRDIGQVLGVSESRVSRMSTEIVAKLRRRLRDW